MVRNNCNAYFHNAMEYMYKVITVQDELYLDLVPGYRTYSEWFDSDIELKSVFRSIEEGSDQATIYGSIVDNLVSALFPADKITISGSVDQTKYAAMKELFQWMGSYNIAYLNTSSVQYESLYIHPITITPREIIGENTRVMIADKEKHWTFNGMNAWDHRSWTTSEFKSYKFYENWDTALVNWSWLPSPEITIMPTGNVGINVDAETAVRFYGSVVAATRLPEFEVRMPAQPGIYRSGKCSNKWVKNNRSSWTSIRKSTSDDPEIIARFDNEIEDKGHSVIYLEPTGTKGVVVDEETAILLYGSVEAAINIPHFRTKYVTIKSNK
jgi:hypothetical protein